MGALTMTRTEREAFRIAISPTRWMTADFAKRQ